MTCPARLDRLDLPRLASSNQKGDSPAPGISLKLKSTSSRPQRGGQSVALISAAKRMSPLFGIRVVVGHLVDLHGQHVDALLQGKSLDLARPWCRWD